MSNRSTILTIVGPSGSGKSTLCYMLEDAGCGRIITTTSRPPREGEIDGHHYHFSSVEQMLKDKDAGLFVEQASFGGNLYGIKKDSLFEAARKSSIGCAVVVCERKGYEKLAQLIGNHHESFILEGIFLHVSLDILKKRLALRYDLNSPEHKMRLELMREELLYVSNMVNSYASIIHSTRRHILFNPTLKQTQSFVDGCAERMKHACS